MGFGIWEIGLILVVALVVIGPDKLPDMAKSLGKGYAEFKRTFGEIKKSVDISMDAPAKNSSAKTYSQTYKSRWEEQAAPTEEAPKIEVAESTATATEPPAEEKKAPTRGRRADLIQEEDNDGKNG